MDFQCKECGATPQGKHEDHYELCNCGMIAVSGGEYPRVDALYPEIYTHYLDKEETTMGRTKDFIIQVSEDMGYEEINDEVMAEAQDRWENQIDSTYDRLKDPEPAREPVFQVDEPRMVKYGNNELEMLFGDTRLFYSYTTLVAIYEPETKTIYVADTKYSKTTSKHINKWVSLVKEEQGDCSEAVFTVAYLSLDMKLAIDKTSKGIYSQIFPTCRELTSRE